MPWSISQPLLESSAKPPSPPCAPPRAEMWPRKPVACSEKTTMLPPSPAVSASARSELSASTSVRSAFTGPAPRSSPPMRIWPPPVAPDASTFAPSSHTRVPITRT